MPTMAGRVRPIEKFAEAVGKCSVEVRRLSSSKALGGKSVNIKQAVAYGKCILADYQFVHQDMCAKEFVRLKDCYLVIRFALVSARCSNLDAESCKEAITTSFVSMRVMDRPVYALSPQRIL